MRRHTLGNHKTIMEQEKWLRNKCKPCPEGLFQLPAGLTCGKQPAVSHRQQVTGAQGQLQLGFSNLYAHTRTPDFDTDTLHTCKVKRFQHPIHFKGPANLARAIGTDAVPCKYRVCAHGGPN